MDVIAWFFNGSRWVWVTIAVIAALAITIRLLGW